MDRKTKRLLEMERFANVVRMHENLYNKFSPGFKDRNVKALTWKTVAKKANLKSGTAAAAKFRSMRKMYTMLKAEVRKKSKSGSATKLSQKAKNKFAAYSFLAWLDSYILPRRTHTNIDSDEQSGSENDELTDEDPREQGSTDEDQEEELDESESDSNRVCLLADLPSDNERGGDSDAFEDRPVPEESILNVSYEARSPGLAHIETEPPSASLPSNSSVDICSEMTNRASTALRNKTNNSTAIAVLQEPGTTSNNCQITQSVPQSTPVTKVRNIVNRKKDTSEVTGRKKWTKNSTSHTSAVEQEEIRALRAISERIIAVPSAAANEDDIDILGKYISSSLRKLSTTNRVQAEAEINTILMKYQCRESGINVTFHTDFGETTTKPPSTGSLPLCSSPDSRSLTLNRSCKPKAQPYSMQASTIIRPSSPRFVANFTSSSPPLPSTKNFRATTPALRLPVSTIAQYSSPRFMTHFSSHVPTESFRSTDTSFNTYSFNTYPFSSYPS